MLFYCLKCRENAGNKNPKILKTKNGRIMFLSKCLVRNSKKWKFLKEQETRGLLCNFTGKKIPILNDLLITNTLF